MLASADADALKSALATAWKVPESALQWLVVETVSQSARQAEGAYVDIRAKAKSGRTKQAVQQACAETAEALRQAGFRDRWCSEWSSTSPRSSTRTSLPVWQRGRAASSEACFVAKKCVCVHEQLVTRQRAQNQSQ